MGIATRANYRTVWISFLLFIGIEVGHARGVLGLPGQHAGQQRKILQTTSQLALTDGCIDKGIMVITALEETVCRHPAATVTRPRVIPRRVRLFKQWEITPNTTRLRLVQKPKHSERSEFDIRSDGTFIPDVDGLYIATAVTDVTQATWGPGGQANNCRKLDELRARLTVVPCKCRKDIPLCAKPFPPQNKVVYQNDNAGMMYRDFYRMPNKSPLNKPKQRKQVVVQSLLDPENLWLVKILGGVAFSSVVLTFLIRCARKGGKKSRGFRHHLPPADLEPRTVREMGYEELAGVVSGALVPPKTITLAQGMRRTTGKTREP